jgi:hypothetical protein
MRAFYSRFCISVYISLFFIGKAFADISIGGNDHSKDFQIVSDLGTTFQGLLFGVGSKSAGTACGAAAIFFLAKRRWGLCALMIICAGCFFALKTVVTNFSTFAPAQGN